MFTLPVRTTVHTTVQTTCMHYCTHYLYALLYILSVRTAVQTTVHTTCTHYCTHYLYTVLRSSSLPFEFHKTIRVNINYILHRFVLFNELLFVITFRVVLNICKYFAKDGDNKTLIKFRLILSTNLKRKKSYTLTPVT